MALFVCTGANGFIGTHIVESLLKAGPAELGLQESKPPKGFGAFEKGGEEGGVRVLAVLGADLEHTLARSNASRFMRSSRYSFVAHNELFPRIEGLSEKPLAIVHNGACSSTTETDPEIYASLNLKYSQMLWELCVRYQIPFIYASSAGVYGDGSRGFSDKKQDNSKYEPLSLYAKSKHDFDVWALAQKKTPPLWFGLRYFNVYGPFEAHKEGQASMVFHGYNQITRTGKFRLFKSSDPKLPDGGQLRDFVYVKDITAITLELLKRSLAHTSGAKRWNIEGNGAFINIGVGQARSFNDLGIAIFKALNLEPKIEYFDMPQSLAKQYQNFTCADHHGLREVGIEHAFTTLEDGVTEYVLKYLCRGL